MLKRSFDIFASLIGLLILLPFLVIISILIVLDSKGGVFYRQIRGGKSNVDFKLFNFRTMHLNADKKWDISLKNIEELPEVVIAKPVSGASDNVAMSPITLSKEQLTSLPMPGGEADLLRQAALEPGVQSGVDGLGGLHVRGGNADQNLG